MQVLESWRMVLKNTVRIRLEDVSVVVGDSLAFVTCAECVDAGTFERPCILQCCCGIQVKDTLLQAPLEGEWQPPMCLRSRMGSGA